MKINNKKVKLQIWDTAGQERFKTVTSAYYRGADGIVIVYDQTDVQSFEHLNNWLDDISKYTTDAPVKLVLANNNDLKEGIIVTEEQIKNFSQSKLKNAANKKPFGAVRCIRIFYFVLCKNILRVMTLSALVYYPSVVLHSRWWRSTPRNTLRYAL